MHEIENLCHRVKLERAITLQKRNVLSAESEGLLQANRQSLALNNRRIDPERTIGRKLDDDRFGTGHRIRTCGLLRQVRLEPHLVVRMIMKMTKSTSRISINGITFTPDKIPRLPPREAKAMSHLAVKE